MKTLLCAAALALLTAMPAAAQSQSETSSDRYTRDRPQQSPDQQAQTREGRKSGEVETLRNRSMSSPNVTGQKVPEDPATGVPAPDQRGRVKQSESVPRP